MGIVIKARRYSVLKRILLVCLAVVLVLQSCILTGATAKKQKQKRSKSRCSVCVGDNISVKKFVKVSNKKILKKTKSGVKAKKTGTSKIICRNKTVIVHVHKPSLNFKKKTLIQNAVTYLCVKDTPCRPVFKTSNSNVVFVSEGGRLVAKNPGKAVITAQMNKKRLLCRVTVKPHTKSSLVTKQIVSKTRFELRKKKISTNVGCENTPCVNHLLSVNCDNAFTDSSLSYQQICENRHFVNSPKYFVLNTKVARLVHKDNTLCVYGVRKGHTSLKIVVGHRVFTVKINVTKKTYTKFKGKRCRIIYSDKQLYRECYNTFYNRVLKGKKIKSEYITLYYKTPHVSDYVERVLSKKSKHNVADGKNFGYYIADSSWLYSWCQGAVSTVSNLVIQIHLDERTRSKIAQMYSKAQSIIKRYSLSKKRTNFDNLLRINQYFNDNITYKSLGEGKLRESYVLLHNKGVCDEYARTTVYLCSLIGVPCYYVSSYCHAWNVVYVDRKWYYSDNLWNRLFRGKKTIGRESAFNRNVVIQWDSLPLKTRNIQRYSK